MSRAQGLFRGSFPPHFALWNRASGQGSLWVTLVALMALFVVPPAGAQKVGAGSGSAHRIALVIGNGDYQYGGRLKNPVNDADAMAKTLKDLGFEVILCKEATSQQMVNAISEFGDKLTNDCIALAYYSGHGIQIDGVNYLLPVNFNAKKRSEVQFEAVSAARIMAQFEEKKSPVNIVILDACRNNPFKSFIRSNEGGLGKMNAPKGTLIAYATAPDSVADDNSDAPNGLYTTELLKQMVVPAIKVEDMFKRVLEGVASASEEKQLPWLEGSLRGNLYLARGTGNEKIKEDTGQEVDLKARLKVNATPEGASVSVDGAAIKDGTFLMSLLDAEKKTVKVTVTAAGYEPKQKVVELERGVLKIVEFALEKSSGGDSGDAEKANKNERERKSESPPLNGKLVTTWRNPKDGAEVILIPAGAFDMGDDDPVIKDYEQNIPNNPRHKALLSAFSIYKNLVTVGQYEKFCRETRRGMPRPPDFNPGWAKKDHPIVNVSWEWARAYCKWAGGDLPTEAQWEKAARGTDGRKYPWGNTFDTSKLWCSTAKAGDAGGTAKAGNHPSGASPYGVLDMAGNVMQWCRDWYDADFSLSRPGMQANPLNEFEGDSKMRVLRGGSWNLNIPIVFRSAFRLRDNPINYDPSWGFRCVLPPK